MHIHYPSIDLCSLCQIIGRDEASNLLTKCVDDAIANEVFEKEQLPPDTIQLDKDTIIIGNGPAGISLSTILSGWHPFYDLDNPHPNPQIHQMLSQFHNESLLFQDLSPISDLLQTEFNQNLNPFAALYDALARPIPNDANYHSCLKWRQIPTQRVDHIVLGDSPVGGSWTGYEDEMRTVSISNWMDLPGYSLAHDFLADPEFAAMRPNARQFKNYLIAYSMAMGIESNFRPFTQITQIQKLCDPQNGQEFWELKGIQKINGEPFTFRCRNVVMACGQSHPRQLGVPGENDSPQSSHLVYNLSALKRCLLLTAEENDEWQQNESNEFCPVLVIGDGISAADAVLSALAKGYPVLHVIRRNERQLRNVMLSRLSSSVYPEYTAIFQLMIGQRVDPNYTRMTETNVLAVNGNEVSLETANGLIIQQKFRCLAICIGRKSELSLLPGTSKFEFSNDYQSTMDPTLFAVGAMAGDHFVRYLVGGALRVGQILVNTQRERRWEWESRMECKRFKCTAESFDIAKSGNFGEKMAQNQGMVMANDSSRNGTIPRTNSATPLVQKKESMISRAKSTMQLGVGTVTT